jgi:hypothetical protein
VKKTKQANKNVTSQAHTLRKLRAGLRTKLRSTGGLFELVSQGLDCIDLPITELAVNRDTQKVVRIRQIYRWIPRANERS